MSLRGIVWLRGRGYSAFGKRTSLCTLRPGFGFIRQQIVLRPSSDATRDILRPNRGLSGLIFNRYYTKEPKTEPAITVARADTSTPTPPETGTPTKASTPVPPELASTTRIYEVTGLPGPTSDVIFTYCGGSLAGLYLLRPTIFIQLTMETIHSTIHLPWFWTIVAGTAIWRLLLLPISIGGLRNTSRLRPYLHHIRMLNTGICADREDQLKKIYDKAGATGDGSMVTMAQVPVTLGTLFAVKSVCDLPKGGLKLSGVDFIQDLTIADPTWILPIVWAMLVNIQIPLGAAEMDFKTRPAGAHFMNGLRVLSILAIWITAFFPAGLVVSLITTSAFSITQSAVLRYRPPADVLVYGIYLREPSFQP